VQRMKKVIVIAMVLMLTLAITPAAFASVSQSGSISFGSHGHSWYSEGDLNGYTTPEYVVLDPEVVVNGIYENSYGETGRWYSYVDSNGREKFYFVPERTQPVLVQGAYHDNSGDTGRWYSYVNSNGEKQYYFVPENRKPVVVKGVFDYNSRNVLLPDFDRDGQWEFYKDSRGVLHYSYVDPDREGEYQRYTDGNGVTQYVYQYNSW